ncbi:autotransporter outer membrane beta-barrel domain-containing protein [Bradyrhizobium sp. McL0616]|uniref:autotransporter family protein n=1 Tax=Bradyrhizobium sp. McL0616 TaxID=3415674 RepID=UPI003CF1BF0C
MLVGAPPTVRAQCTTSPSNGGIAQNGGAPCTVSTPVTVGFGTAVAATNSAAVTTNAAVTAHGFGTGISAATNSVVTVNGPVTASGLGLGAASGARIVANGILLQNDGGGGAIAMSANNATIIANGITVVWPNGGGQSLVQALAGGLIQFTPGSSLTVAFGGIPSALLASGTGSRIIADGLTLSMGGSGGITAVSAQSGGNIQLTGGSITFSGGGGNTGLSATGANSAISATGVSILVGTGGGDVGANAASGGQVTLMGGSVSVLGGGGGETGLRATGAGSAVIASDVAVTVTGSGGDAGVGAANGGAVITTGGSVSVENGAGGLLQNGGTATMAGTNVTASGNGGYGFLFNNGGSANALLYSNATIVASAASFSVQGATANISLNNAVAIKNNNTLLEAVSGSATTFNAQGSTLGGVISTQSGSTSTINLALQTRWRMTGNSTATNLTNDNSTINFTPPTGDPTQLSSYKTLTVTNYTGANGRIGLNTFLGTDGSPSDMLVINGGNASGTSRLKITNTTGPGAETTGNGIQVVQVINGGKTAAGAFALAGEVRGGAFDYFLFRGGPVAGTDPNDWFLRSTFTTGGGGGDGGGGVLPPDPPGPILPPGTHPIIGPELATYGSVQPMARQIGLTTLGTLNQRIGDTMTLFNAGTDPNGWDRSDWARMFGQQINGHSRAFADPRASGWLAGFQGGVDLWRGSTIPGHRDSAGLYFAYTQASANVTGLVTNPTVTGYMLTPTGTNDIEAYSAGGYWTHYGPTGWYLDAILQVTLYRGNATTQFSQLPIKGTGLAASLETGYPIPLPLGAGFTLEPQVQIIWQRVAFDDANDGLGQVGMGTTSGPIGRLGLRGQWNFQASNGTLWQPYVGVNYWRGWGADATTNFGVDQVQLKENMQTVEAFVGCTGKFGRSFSVYAQGGYQFGVGSTINAGPRGAKATAGVRYSW